MKWKNLNKNHCPKCDSELVTAKRGKQCGRCGFFISQKKLLELFDNFDREDLYKKMEGYGFDK